MRLTLFFILVSYSTLFAQEIVPPPVMDLPDNRPKIKVEIIDLCGCGLETHYAGGIAALSAFVNKHISLKDVRWGNTERVRAYVEFVVEKDGSLTNLHVIRTNFPEIDENILAVFRKMTNWIAGEEKCFPHRTNVRVPVSVIVK